GRRLSVYPTKTVKSSAWAAKGIRSSRATTTKPNLRRIELTSRRLGRLDTGREHERDRTHSGISSANYSYCLTYTSRKQIPQPPMQNMSHILQSFTTFQKGGRCLLGAICFSWGIESQSQRLPYKRCVMTEAVIVSSVRTPVGRGYKGSLRTSRPDDLAALVIKQALAWVAALDAKEIDDVILGCAMPEGEQGMNVARIAALRAGLPVETSAMTVNRFCASGLEAIALAAERIRSGAAQVIVAGGTESMSLVPMGGNKISPN